MYIFTINAAVIEYVSPVTQQQQTENREHWKWKQQYQQLLAKTEVKCLQRTAPSRACGCRRFGQCKFIFVTLPLMRNCNLLRLPKRQLECREAIAGLRARSKGLGGKGGIAYSTISTMPGQFGYESHEYIAFLFNFTCWG